MFRKKKVGQVAFLRLLIVFGIFYFVIKMILQREPARESLRPAARVTSFIKQIKLGICLGFRVGVRVHEQGHFYDIYI